MAKLNNIIIHCSDSEFGSAADIRRWHTAQGWSDIGYHFVILNGVVCAQAKGQTRLILSCMDGCIEAGRHIDGDGILTGTEVGAHTLGYNDSSIGICLIGIKTFTAKQFLSLAKLITELKAAFPVQVIKGHYQVSSNRTCPNFNVPAFLQDMPLLMLPSTSLVQVNELKKSWVL